MTSFQSFCRQHISMRPECKNKLPLVFHDQSFLSHCFIASFFHGLHWLLTSLSLRFSLFSTIVCHCFPVCHCFIVLSPRCLSWKIYENPFFDIDTNTIWRNFVTFWQLKLRQGHLSICSKKSEFLETLCIVSRSHTLASADHPEDHSSLEWTMTRRDCRIIKVVCLGLTVLGRNPGLSLKGDWQCDRKFRIRNSHEPAVIYT